jgi:hypothetical protein
MTVTVVSDKINLLSIGRPTGTKNFRHTGCLKHRFNQVSSTLLVPREMPSTSSFSGNLLPGYWEETAT